MSNNLAKLKEYAFSDDTRHKFEALLKERAATFLTSMVQIASSNDMLRDAEPSSIINAALTAATLDLPLNNNLGFAWIVPYGKQAQFQIGWKGFIQLAQRSGQFKSISQCPVYEGQLISENPLDGNEYDFTKPKIGSPIGYVAKFTLVNGFQATLYMSKADMENHAKKYSKTYKSNRGTWVDNFDAMAKKTVIKLLLANYAPLSVTMQTAILADQSIVKETETGDFEYIDNSKELSEPATLDDVKSLYDRINDFEVANNTQIISTDEAINIERIISEKEEKSYANAVAFLNTKIQEVESWKQPA
jgi:recombination protein RecT